MFISILLESSLNNVHFDWDSNISNFGDSYPTSIVNLSKHFFLDKIGIFLRYTAVFKDHILVESLLILNWLKVQSANIDYGDLIRFLAYTICHCNVTNYRSMSYSFHHEVSWINCSNSGNVTDLPSNFSRETTLPLCIFYNKVMVICFLCFKVILMLHIIKISTYIYIYVTSSLRDHINMKFALFLSCAYRAYALFKHHVLRIVHFSYVIFTFINPSYLYASMCQRKLKCAFFTIKFIYTFRMILIISMPSCLFIMFPCNYVLTYPCPYIITIMRYRIHADTCICIYCTCISIMTSHNCTLTLSSYPMLDINGIFNFSHVNTTTMSFILSAPCFSVHTSYCMFNLRLLLYKYARSPILRHAFFIFWFASCLSCQFAFHTLCHVLGHQHFMQIHEFSFHTLLFHPCITIF